MTDADVDAQYTVFAVMLAAPYLNGDHGELPDVHGDIQATLLRHGYIPAQKPLFEEGATPGQVARAKFKKKILFGILEADG